MRVGLLGARGAWLSSAARVSSHHPAVVLLGGLLLAAISILYTSSHLEFRSRREDLISPGARYHRIYQSFGDEFRDLDNVVVVVKGLSLAQSKAFANCLASVLRRDREHVREVFHRLDPSYFEDKALLYLSLEDLRSIEERLREHRDFLVRFSQEPGLNSLVDGIEAEIRKATVSHLVSSLLGLGEEAPSKAPVDLGLITSIVTQMAARLVASTPYRSPWASLIAKDEGRFSEGGYLVSEDGKLLYINVTRADDPPSEPIEAIRQHIRALLPDYAGVEAGVTGTPALAYDEKLVTARDIAVASVLGFLANAIVVIVAFRGLLKPGLILATLVIAGCWSFGATTLIIGHLNLLSAVFISILIGIGINPPIHFLARYEEARAQGHGVTGSIELTVVRTGEGVTAATAIMVVAFLAPFFTDFLGIKELGIVSAMALVLCLLAAVTIFPALLALSDRTLRWWQRAAERRRRRGQEKRRRPRPKESQGWLDRAVSWAYSNPATLLLASLGLSFYFLPWCFAVRFNSSVLDLQAREVEAVKYQSEILKSEGAATWFAVSLASGREEVIRKAKLFSELPTVKKVTSILDLVPGDQPEKIALLKTFPPLLRGIEPRSKPTSIDVGRLRGALERIDRRLGAAEGAWKPGAKPPEPEIRACRDAIATFLDRLLLLEPAAAAALLEEFQRELVGDFVEKIDFLKRSLDPSPITEEDLPEALRKRFVGLTGKYLLRVYAKENIWKAKALKSFVADVSRVDRDVTGGPVHTYFISEAMKKGYQQAAIFAFAGILLLAVLDLRSWRLALIALVPLFAGSLWTLEQMGLANLPFNLANLYGIPLIIGMAIDNGINLIYRYREEREGRLLLRTAVGKSVLLCSLTTITGFGALIPAKHQGVASLGLILTLGVTNILLASLVIVPALLVIWDRRRLSQHPTATATEQEEGIEASAGGAP